MGKQIFCGCWLVLAFAAGFAPAVQAAAVEFFSPTGEVKQVRQVTARFAEPMVAFGDPREVEPFTIACPVSGQGRWADQRNWIYDFERDLPAGMACTFTLKDGLVASSGQVISGGEQFSFNTGGPAIVHSEPREGDEAIDENQIFILGLDAPATPESIRANAACMAEGLPEQIPIRLLTGIERSAILAQRPKFLTSYYEALFKRGPLVGEPVILGVEERGSERERFLRLREGEDSPIVVVQCQRPLPNATEIRLQWGKGIQALSGVATTAAQNLPFRTRPVFTAEFSCPRVNVDAECIPVLPMHLDFSAPIATKAAAEIRLVASDGKVIRAELAKSEQKNDFVHYLSFPAPFPPLTEYKIELPPDLRDDAGRRLANGAAFPLAVRTDDDPPLAKFAARFGILELNGSATSKPLLPVTLRNVESSIEASLSKAGADGKGDGIGGQLARSDAGMEALNWLRRLAKIDNPIYHDDPLTGESIREGGPGKVSIFGAADRRKQFQLTKPLGSKPFEVAGILLKDPGFYMVELASPRLGEALHGEKRPYYAHAAALVTNLSVHFKQGRESSLVWVTSLDQGQPVAGAQVAVRDCAGKTHFTGRTDRQGILRIEQGLPALGALPACLNDYDKQYFVTASLGADSSFVFSDWNEGIALWRFNAYQNSWEGHNLVHAVLDRTLLRAGETVHLKLLRRRQTTAGFAAPTDSGPAAITIVHQGSEEKYQLPVKWDGQGIAVLDWQIPLEAKQGSYLVQIPDSESGDKTAGEFRVESFRVATMKALVHGGALPLVNAEKVTLALQVNYLSGGGATNLPVKLRGQLRPKAVSFPDYDDFTFANGQLTPGVENIGSEAWYAGDYELADGDEEATAVVENQPTHDRLLPTQSLQLDAAGGGQVTFAPLPKSSVPQDLLAELEYPDPNGAALTASTHLPLWPAQVVVGIKPDGWLATAEQLKFQVVVLDLTGRPVAGCPVTVAALQREYFSHRRRVLGGFYAYEHRSEINPRGELCRGLSDERGMLFCEVKPPVAGNLILQAQARDGDGNESSAHREVWVAGEQEWWFDASDNDRIDLLPEKKQYEPGETARFQLRTPFKDGTALVTVEREGVMESFVTAVGRDQPVLEVPIRKNYAPNVFVSALVVRGRVAGIQPTALVDLGKPAFKMGLAEIRVGWTAHELKVKVQTDKAVYKVREQAKVAIEVRLADGSLPPAGSEIALAAVDEGLLELRPNHSWPLLEAMMKRRGLEVATATAQMQVIGKRHFGRKSLAAGGGGGKQSARELFDTLLFWQARIKLDSNGRAQLLVPLNDSLTSFRIVAVANGGSGMFGTGANSIQSSQELMLLSGLPPLVREQDRYRAGFTVRNASSRPLLATVTASLSVGKDSPGKGLEPIKINLPAGEAREIGWETVAPTGAELLRWEVAVREQGASEDGDQLKVSQKVIAAVPVRTLQATIFPLSKPEALGIKIPEGAWPGRGGVRVGFKPQLSDGLPGVREFMSRYPYSCFEQKASQAVALQDKPGWLSLMKSLPAHLDQAGLVKYFPTLSEGDDTLTAYLLALAEAAGYEIPEAARLRMLGGLTDFVEGRVIRYSPLPTVDLTVRKLAAIAALAGYGEIRPGWLDSLSIEPNLWPTSGVLDWLTILKRSPTLPRQPERLAEAQQIIRSRLNFQGTSLGFSTERNDALWWLMINSDVNANRALLALLDLAPWQPDIPRLVRGALGRQQGGHWQTTVANAWGVLALRKFSEKFEKTPVTGSSTAILGPDKFTVTWPKAVGDAQKTFPWPKAPAALNLTHSGAGQPWVTVQSLAALPLTKPLFTGYRLVRRLMAIEQKKSGTWHKGDVVRVHLDIEAQSDMSWVVVNDPVPAGATILGSGLGGDSQILTRNEKKQGWVWPAFEERAGDSFRAYYRLVPKGKFALEYTLRLNNDGDFNLPPTRVEAMYAPEMFGELPNEKITVKP
ncbi:MAG: alpha-2-macroglobulin [Desulfobulbaceae bacterium]|nr:alpha-2-macroglobulin [Desulfobulbaceae bacterium]